LGPFPSTEVLGYFLSPYGLSPAQNLECRFSLAFHELARAATNVVAKV
jgi:hypothetical protein